MVVATVLISMNYKRFLKQLLGKDLKKPGFIWEAYAPFVTTFWETSVWSCAIASSEPSSQDRWPLPRNREGTPALGEMGGGTTHFIESDLIRATQD
jgi:hypothetical protein